MQKMFLAQKDIDNAVHDIVRQMYKQEWRPDYIVGITRGGLYPAIIMSHQYDLPMYTLDVRLRDGLTGNESNAWMSEDAFGYISEAERELYKSRWDPRLRKNILIIDDINDTGATFNWIKDDWRATCLPDETYSWDQVFGDQGNVRFAAIVNNLSSECDISYSSIEINKAEKDEWIVFPWELN